MKFGSLTTALLAVSLSCAAHPAASAKGLPKTWEATRTTDPVTGTSTCVVAAYDRVGSKFFGGGSFTRVGVLYPIVENNSRLGLLIGVSSGGPIRIPTGDVLWRVDDKPFRELKSVDNPDLTAAASGSPSPSDPAAKAMQDTTELAMRIARTAAATSTVASGDRAKEMLREMQDGSSLIYRAAIAAPTYGLPSGATYRVGQITKDGLRPIPIDQSFRAALTACGIN